MTVTGRAAGLGPAASAIDALLSHLRSGTLEIEWPGGTRAYSGPRPGVSARVVVHDVRSARRLITSGSIGMAEGYMAGEWDTPDLYALLDLGAANLPGSGLRMPPVFNPLLRSWNRSRDNTLRGSRRNIAHHYDLGNEFYRLWLDETMTYSGALFEDPSACGDVPLESAQRRKWDRLLELLQPSRTDHLLEIGCGWGGFAMHAVRESGCRVTGVTLSREQHEWAGHRIAEEGLSDRVDIRLQDYRDVPDTFTSAVSIEMFEAVGERWWPVFFARLGDMLRRGGRAAIQTITIDESTFEHYRANPDFIQRYIFPGGMLPSLERFRLAATDAGLAMGEPHLFGACYATTLERWARSFEGALPGIRALGFDERFIRMWRYYLAYCRAGFRSGTVDVMQVALDR